MSAFTAPLTTEADSSGPVSGPTGESGDLPGGTRAVGAVDTVPDESISEGATTPPAEDDSPPVISLDPAAGIDASMLAQLADAGADLSQARRIAHFVYVPDEASATAVVADLADTFTAVVWTPTDTQPEWTVVAEVRDAPVTAESIAADDTAFSTLAETHGGRYDGWEATV